MTADQAKDFIATVIVDQAQRDGVAVSDVERKMLYFSETEESADLNAVNEAFDREYDQSDYEQKIATLIRNAIVRLKAEDAAAFERWTAATKCLIQGDHYLTVMIKHPNAFVRPPGDMLKLWATGAALCLAFVAFALWSHC